MKGLTLFPGKKMCIRTKIPSHIRSSMSLCLGSESPGGPPAEPPGHRVCRPAAVTSRGTWDGGRTGARSGQHQGKEAPGGGHWAGVHASDSPGPAPAQVRMPPASQQDSTRCFWVTGGGRPCAGGGVMQCVEITSSCSAKISSTRPRHVRAPRPSQRHLNVQNCTLSDLLRNNYWKKKKHLTLADSIICRAMALRFTIKNSILFTNRIFLWPFVAFSVKIRFLVSMVTILKTFHYVVKSAWSLNVSASQGGRNVRDLLFWGSTSGFSSSSRLWGDLHHAPYGGGAGAGEGKPGGTDQAEHKTGRGGTHPPPWNQAVSPPAILSERPGVLLQRWLQDRRTSVRLVTYEQTASTRQIFILHP